MTFKEAQKEIESGGMVARVNVANGLKTFLRAIQSEPAVPEMQRSLSSKDVQEQVLSRIIELSRQRVDRRYENPWDTALTIYLWLLNSIDRNLSAIAADIIAQAPQCWWAQKLSKQLLSERAVRTESCNQAYSLTAQLVPSLNVVALNTESAEFSLDTVLMLGIYNRPVQIRSARVISNPCQEEKVAIYGGHSYLAGHYTYQNVAANTSLADAA